MKYIASLIFLLIISTSFINYNNVIFTSVNSNNTNQVSKANKAGKITNVIVVKNQDSYTFKVEVKSPDTGCNQYANWWEVLTEGEELVYRRILAHSHINEQPFTRSGSVKGITGDQKLIVRVHMNNTGYGTQVFKGTVNSGFNKTLVTNDFGVALEKENPQPNPCRS